MVAPFTVKTAEEIAEDFRRTLENGLRAIGVSNPNVSPGSDFYIESLAIGNELAVAMANIQVKADAMMPDTATEADLDRYGTMLGLTRRSATGATGLVILSSSASVTVPTGAQLTDSNNLRFQVVTGGTFANGATIQVEGVDTGSATNHDAGDVLRWVSTPTFASSTVTVATNGLSNGVDDEDDETFRARVLARLASPPAGGNWTYVSEAAIDSTPKVQGAFVYPAHQGPATLAVAVTAYPTSTSKLRDVDSTTVTNIVGPYVRGVMPEHVDIQVTTVTNVSADIAVGLSLPAAATASPPGPGGGWVNGTPWPQVDGSSVRSAAVSAVTSSTSFSVTATAGVSATPNITKVCWLSYSGSDAWTLYTATVLTCTESPSGTYAITIDTPFPGIAVGDYVFPSAVRMQDYVDAMLEAFGRMGPGELRSPTLDREFRHPLPSSSWPNTLGPHLLRAMTDTGDEVLDAQWFSRLPDSTGNYAVQNTSGSVGVPTVVTDAPRIFVPRRIGFYRL